MCDDTSEEQNEFCEVYEILKDNIEVFPDHVMINNTFPILRTPYFTDRLDTLDHFDGFSPRWIFPQTRMVAMDDHSRHTIATQNMLIIDSKREIYMGVGLNTWPPVELGRDEVMIPE